MTPEELAELRRRATAFDGFCGCEHDSGGCQLEKAEMLGLLDLAERAEKLEAALRWFVEESDAASWDEFRDGQWRPLVEVERALALLDEGKRGGGEPGPAVRLTELPSDDKQRNVHKHLLRDGGEP